MKALRIAGLAGQLLAALVVALLLGAYGVAAYYGAGFAIVEGASMEPLLHTGDLVLLSKKSASEIEVGDIVVFKWGNRYVIHRVVYKYQSESGEYCFVTKGDNNALPDLGDPIRCGSIAVSGLGLASGRPYEDIIGVVMEVWGTPVKIPYIGIVRLFIDQISG